jgi:hypothetical protein
VMQFTDGKDRKWSVEINTDIIKLLRKELNLDLAGSDQSTMDLLSDDPVLLVDALWLICQKEAKERSVTAESFGAALVGDVIDSATQAMVEAVANFFPTRKRSLLLRANAKMRTVREKAEAIAMAKLDDPALEKQLEMAMEAKMEREIKNLLTRLNSPTNSPE